MFKTDSTKNPEIRQKFYTLFLACAMETLLTSRNPRVAAGTTEQAEKGNI
jgi:hypothetical protein